MGYKPEYDVADNMSKSKTQKKAAVKVSYDDFYKSAEAVGENFNSILDTLPVSIIRMKNWKITWCNQFAEQMFSLDADNLNGQKFKDLFNSQEDYKKFLKNSRSDSKKKATSAIKYNMRSGDGERFKAALALSHKEMDKKKKSEVVATILDLTDSCTCKVAELNLDSTGISDYPELAVNEELLKGSINETDQLPGDKRAFSDNELNLINRISDGVVILQDKKICYSNVTFASMVGFDNQELMGRGFVELVSEDSMEQIDTPTTTRSDGAEVKKSYRSILTTKNSKQLAVEFDICSIHYDGKNADMILVKDVSSRELLEEELVKKDRMLDEVNLRVNDAAIQKTQFLSNMSHELRTPLNSIIGYTELLLYGMEGPVSNSQRDSLSKIVKNGYQLLDMINDILDISNVQSGRLRIDPKMFDIRLTLAELIPIWQQHFDKKGIKFEYVNSTGFPFVYGDSDRLKQVLSNLFSNAVKFTRGGSAGIVCEDLPDSDFVKIMFWDTGIGIPDENKQYIFDEFRQIDGTLTREFGGTGLGLAVSRHIIEHHGGEIWVEDNPGGGSRFYFTIPKVQTGSNVSIKNPARSGSTADEKVESNKARADGPSSKLCAVMHDKIHWCKDTSYDNEN